MGRFPPDLGIGGRASAVFGVERRNVFVVDGRDGTRLRPLLALLRYRADRHRAEDAVDFGVLSRGTSLVGLYFRLTTARALPALPGGCTSKFKSAKGSADAGSDTSPWARSSSDITSASGEVIADGALAVVGKLPCVLDANDASGVKKL